MCQRTTCRTCGKPTFSGCGMHVEQVLGDVPKDKRCACREADSKGPSLSASWLPSLFGKG